jgi:glycosyltransferase involved in cell wall biosynthesis
MKCKNMKNKTLTIVIPVYNEGERIKQTLITLSQGFSYRGIKLETIIFANDGSNDNTLKLLKDFKPQLEKKLKVEVQIISYNKNKGRGYAVRCAALHSTTDYTLYADADLSIPLSNLETFTPYMEQNYDLIFGSKKKPGATAQIERDPIRKIVGYGHSLVASSVLGVFAWDFQGGFKIFSKKLIKEVFPRMSVDRWGFDMEVIFLAKKLGYKTIELPIVWGHVEVGTKVKLVRDIYRSLHEMVAIRYLWIKTNYKHILHTNVVLHYF